MSRIHNGATRSQGTNFQVYFCLYFFIFSSFVCACLLLIFIFIVAKVVFTCEDVKSDGSRFEDGGFASVVSGVGRTGIPDDGRRRIVLQLIVFDKEFISGRAV